MNTLPDEVLIEVVHRATDVASELDPNLDDRFHVPSPADMEEMLKEIMPTRRALVRVSRRLWRLAITALYRSIIITKPQTSNLFFKSITESGERSLLFRHGVQRFHVSILDFDWVTFPGTEELMKYLPNLKISCARGEPHPVKPLLFTALDPVTSFPHLEAIQLTYPTSFSIISGSLSNLLRSSPNLRVFLVPYRQDMEPRPDLYAFKYLRGCYNTTMIESSANHYSIRPNLEVTNTQPLSSQTPFPLLCSLHCTGATYQNVNYNLARHITLLDLTFYGGREDILVLSQFPQLRTLVIPHSSSNWYFHVTDKNDKLREIGVYADFDPVQVYYMREYRDLVELVLGLPVRIQRLRILGYNLCRVYAAFGLHRSREILKWRKELEERGISLEGPDGVPLVEYLASLSR